MSRFTPELAQAMSEHCSTALTLASREDAEDQYDGIARELRAIESLDDRTHSVPLLFQACILWCELSLEVEPLKGCINPDHNHGSSFTLIDPETREELDIDTTPPQLRWAARFLAAARAEDGDTVMALWHSFPDSRAYTKALVQLAVLVGQMIRGKIDELGLGVLGED